MRLALDTNRYTDSARGDAEALRVVEGAEFVFLPFIVLAELRCGFIKGSRKQHNEQLLDRFLDDPRVSALYPDERTVEHFVELWIYLKEKGTAIPTHDLWIASLVVQHGLTLYTRDRHFDRLPQLRRI